MHSKLITRLQADLRLRLEQLGLWSSSNPAQAETGHGPSLRALLSKGGRTDQQA